MGDLDVAWLVDDAAERSQTFVADQRAALSRLGVRTHAYACSVLSIPATVDESAGGESLLAAPRPVADRMLAVLAAAWRLRGHLRVLARSLDLWRSGRRAASGRLVMAAERIIHHRPVLAHAHFGPNGLWAAHLRMAGAFRCPLVVSFYGYDVSAYPARYGQGCYAPLFEQASVILALSEDMRSRLEGLGCPRDRIRIHRLGVDVGLLPFRPTTVTASPLRLLFVGRLVEKKGAAVAIHALSLLAAEQPEACLTIVGEGPLRQELESLAGELGLSSRVTFTGWLSRETAWEAMVRASALVAPSLRASNADEEGTPTAIIEALALGTPVIGTAHAGIPELLDQGRAGGLAIPGSAESLADAIRRAMTDSRLTEERRHRGRRRVEALHDTERLGRDLHAMYLSLVTPESGSRGPREH